MGEHIMTTKPSPSPLQTTKKAEEPPSEETKIIELEQTLKPTQSEISEQKAKPIMTTKPSPSPLQITKKAEEPPSEETKHSEPAQTFKPTQSEISSETTQQVQSPSKQAEQMTVEATEKPRPIIQ